MRKYNEKSNYTLILFCMIWVYYSLNARYINFSLFTILRWIFPVLLIGVSALMNKGRIVAPPMLVLWFTVAVIPPSLLGADPTTSIVKYISWVLIFYGSYIYLYQLRSIDNMNRCLHVLFSVLVVFQLLNFAFTAAGIGEISGRSTGITTNANTLGIYSNLAFWAGVYWFGRAENRVYRVAWGLLIATTAYTAIECGSRTAIVVLAINILAVIFLMQKKHSSVFLWAAGMGVVAYLILAGKLDFLNIAAIERLSEEGGTTRDELWEYAFTVWRGRPEFGVGYTLSPQFNRIERNMAFHNSYISFLVECGLWGVTILGISMVPVIVRIVSCFKNVSDIKDQSEFSIGCIMLVGLAVAAWSESFMFAVGSTEGFTFWFLLAWAMVYVKHLKHRKHDLDVVS